jgi:hypothetical protein
VDFHRPDARRILAFPQAVESVAHTGQAGTGEAGLCLVSGAGLSDRGWEGREGQQTGRSATAERDREALGAPASQPDGGAARHGLQ